MATDLINKISGEKVYCVTSLSVKPTSAFFADKIKTLHAPSYFYLLLVRNSFEKILVMEPASLIKNKDFQNPLRELGYSITELLSADQVKQLKELYNEQEIDKRVTGGLYANHRASALEQSVYVSNEIFKIILPSLENTFEDFECFIAHFMVKEAKTATEFSLHQDWNILDEDDYTSYQIWIPLDITAPANGGMFVLPSSHLFFHNQRSGSYGIPKVPTDDSLKPLIADISLNPGQVLIYHNSLFHGSYPNNSDKNRVAVIANIRQKGAFLRYAHKNALTGKTEHYAITGPLLLEALPMLEKGDLPEFFTNPVIGDGCQVNNQEINSHTLYQKFKETFKGSMLVN